MALHYGSSSAFLLLLLFISSRCAAKTSLILPVTKDSSTLQYTTHVYQRTPLVPVKLTVDLGGNSLLLDCEEGYVSSSYKSVNCKSAHCVLAKPTSCGDGCYTHTLWYCNKKACFTSQYNLLNQTSLLSYTFAEAAEDVLSIPIRSGSTGGETAVSVPRFVFNCVPTWFIGNAVARGVKGMAGLGRSYIALPTQLAQAFSFPRKFALCLSSSTKEASGVIVFGDYRVDRSKLSLIYTPILTNPRSSKYIGQRESSEYFIGVKSIRVNGKKVPLNTTLLSFDDEGNGGTRISTVNPYTILESSIYEAVKEAFVRELPASVTGVTPPPGAPFGVCFRGIHSSSREVPSIDLVFPRKNVYWRIHGANSMVQVGKDVTCLGFVDGRNLPLLPASSVVIGGHQIEDNLLEFDLQRSRVGFSSSLSLHQTTCAHFHSMSSRV
ncbi:hypothetical protein ACH5RR_004937 [Cinchona calisaya]|uniref:Peptidase A1 domain-containing protein n=1 Tax=Cinchona calisaya TaxID=153742 RepID=A0ABD3AZ55_9GENT